MTFMDSSDVTSLAIAIVGAVVAAAAAIQPQLSGWGSVGVTALVAGGTYFMAHETRPTP